MPAWRPTRHPIGIDVGAHGARMLQLDAHVVADRPRVAAAARMAWPADVRQRVEAGRTPSIEAVAPMLARMANRGQFRGRDVSIAMPRELVRVKNLRLPVMPPDEAVAAAEIDARVMFDATDPGEHVVHAFPAGEVRQGNDTKLELIATCVRVADADALCEAWHAAGFRPASIDFEPAALYRSAERFVRRRDDDAEVNVLVEIGLRRTVVLIGRGRELSFYKAIEIGGAQLTRAVARKLSIDPDDALVLRHRLAETHDANASRDAARGIVRDDPVRQAVVDGVRPIVEELARELALCLRYFSVNFRGQRPTRVRVVGGEAVDPTVVALLDKSLPVPVEVGRQILNADCSAMPAAERAGSPGGWALALGLALRFAKGPFADLTGPARGSVPSAPAAPTPGLAAEAILPSLEIPDILATSAPGRAPAAAAREVARA